VFENQDTPNKPLEVMAKQLLCMSIAGFAAVSTLSLVTLEETVTICSHYKLHFIYHPQDVIHI
jgi:hypothetical protein